MASRILTFVSCTLYLFLLVNFTIIGFASFIIGSIGVGIYIPKSTTYNNYKNNTCSIVDVDNDVCTMDSCYYIMWSIEYYIPNNGSSKYTFSTIKQTYGTSNEALQDLAIYSDRTNHTCYYDKTQTVRVQWKQPSSPTPYLIMIIVGFCLTGIYLIFIGIFYYYRSHKVIQ